MGDGARGANPLDAAYARVYDLVPRAFARRPDPDVPRIAREWRQGAKRLVFPHRGHAGPLEVAVAGEPYLYLARRPEVVVGLRADGVRGLERVAGLLEPGRAERLHGFLSAAARFEDTATTRLVMTDLARPGADVAVRERELPTDHLGAAALGGLVEAGLTRAGGDAIGAFPTGPVPCLVLAEAPVDPEDAVDTRRTTARMVDLWRPTWGLPTPGAVPASDELDRRLAVAYRRSLRQLAGRRPPLEKAALRVEVGELVRLYRELGRVRPRLLGVLAARLHLE